MSSNDSFACSASRPGSGRAPDTSQNCRNGVPRWSVGYSRHSSSRAISWLSPTMYASMKGWFVSSSEIVLGGMRLRFGSRYSSDRSRSGSYIGWSIRG